MSDPDVQKILNLEDQQLLDQCEVDIYKASGPGGQHRNKVSSAVRLRHGPTGLMAHANDSRSQHDNKRLAIKRLRMNIALQLRTRLDPKAILMPGLVGQCLSTPRKQTGKAGKVLQIGRKDHRFWAVAAWLLDLLDVCEGQLGKASATLGISTGNLVRIFKSDRHLLHAVQEMRKRFGLKPLQ
ncbi:MAG: peptide chain release factor family protein [Phycisphaerae bacterium]